MASKKKNKNNRPKDDIRIEKEKIEVVEKENDNIEKIEKEIREKNVEKRETRVSRSESVEEENVATKSEKDFSRERKVFKHPFVHSFLVIVLLVSLAYFIVNLFYTDTDSISTLISNLLLMVFTLMFVSASITTNRKNKTGFFLSGFLLLGYFAFGMLMTFGVISFPNTRVIDFTNKELTEVIKWSEEYKVDIVQEYEYSDMIDEYHIIGQDVEPGTKIKDVNSITVAVSEGPNPSKEIVIPNMVGWDSERVLEFIKENHLSNVEVEFVESSKEVNTVIEQSKSGNLRRDEALKLTFSYGEELEYDEVKLSDLTGMSKFEATFYLKQHHLNYEFEEVFSSDVKKGLVVKQSVKAGTMVSINGDKITISISKGPEIKIPNLKNMTMSEVTEWVIKNKLKLEFTDKYDDSISENSVISANYEEGDIVSESTVIEVVISRGKLVMPEFETYNEFREWAEKYEIKYDEQHEFSDSVKAGEAISYSYKKGETIKNNDTIVVTVSDGKEATVPNVVGSTQAQATSKLKSSGFGYSLVYSYSSTVTKGNVIKQSISGGSKVAQGTTITLTISNGPKPASSSGSSSSGGSSSGGSTTTCDTSKGAVFWTGVGNTGAQVYSATKAQNPGFTITPTYVDSCPNGATTSGMVCSINVTEGNWVSYCTTIKITIVK